MEIRSSDLKAYLLLREQGRDDQYPGPGFLVEVAAPGFRGTSHAVWFTLEALHQFLTKLEQLDQDRAGLASLTSMSPDEASVAFFSLDSAGHIAIKVDLKEYHYLSAGAPYFQAVSVTFEIDPSALPGIVKELAALVHPNALPGG
jgi:hypothetical protein